ncbi:hypothetical protein PoB_001717000 [Plakobranchus ocellatus]|uniref:Uncharacterized protein n=1 Tax=Plakobranchus ocellatus TaxID=259542 RepID=A0AAV3Z5E0_9GAST|nr:hypothetical protein PoB_001717000 [Plakobranchus ocellatus]
MKPPKSDSLLKKISLEINRSMDQDFVKLHSSVTVKRSGKSAFSRPSKQVKIVAALLYEAPTRNVTKRKGHDHLNPFIVEYFVSENSNPEEDKDEERQ